MRCQDCEKRESQVHLTQIVNNEKTTLALCKECAAARGFHSPLENMPFPLAEILSGLTSGSGELFTPDETDKLSCPSCGLSFSQFASQGRFGCGDCYHAFRGKLEPIMRKIHGASLHRGMSPNNLLLVEDNNTLPIQEEERLEQELKKAIEGEEFERAAELRDKLKQLRQAESAEKKPEGTEIEHDV